MISNKILNRIKRKGRGWVFCPKYFHDLTSRAVVDNALSKLVSDNIIVRIDRGIYYYPVYNKYIGMVLPDADILAKVVADSNGMSIMPSGAYAANALGFSNQVPALNSYLSDKKSMKKKIGNVDIYFKKSYLASIKDMPFKIALIVNALNYMGKDKVDGDIIKKCSKILDNADKKILSKVSGRLSYWLSDVIFKIVSV